MIECRELSEWFLLRGGLLFWRKAPRYHAELFGREAGSPGSSALPKKRYWHVQFKGLKIRRSRIVFAMTRGRWPIGEVDHIDGNRLNDQPDNLREATHAENCRNRKRHANNTGLPMGVRKTEQGRFVARICVNGKGITLGVFATPEQASKVYQEARKEYFGLFA